MSAAGTHRPPVHRLAWLGFGASLVAVVLAFTARCTPRSTSPAARCAKPAGRPGYPPSRSHWYDRALANGETTVFGDRIDRKMLALTERSKVANYSLQVVAFVLPFLLGPARPCSAGGP